NHLVARVRQILNLTPEGHAMKLPRGLIALTAALLIVPAGLTISRAHLADAPATAQAKGQPEEAERKVDPRALIAKAMELADAAGTIQGAKKASLQTLLDIGAALAQSGYHAEAAAALRKAEDPIKAMPEGGERT